MIRMEPSLHHDCGKVCSRTALIGRIKEMAATRTRYGAPRINVVLRRED